MRSYHLCSSPAPRDCVDIEGRFCIGQGEIAGSRRKATCSIGVGARGLRWRVMRQRSSAPLLFLPFGCFPPSRRPLPSGGGFESLPSRLMMDSHTWGRVPERESTRMSSCATSTTTALFSPPLPLFKVTGRIAAVGFCSCESARWGGLLWGLGRRDHRGVATGGRLFTARRHASGVGGRPTHQEIAEDLVVLGLAGQIDFSEAALKKRYHELVRNHHPDAGGDERAMVRITIAYNRLKRLTPAEKEEFAQHQRAFRGASSSSSAFSSSTSTSSSSAKGFRARQGWSYAAGSPHSDPFERPDSAGDAYPQRGATPLRGEDFWRHYQRHYQRMQREFQQSSGGGAFSENPFAYRNSLHMFPHLRRVRAPRLTTLLLHALVIYIFLVLLFAAWRERREENGWRVAEHLARYEQLQALHQLRAGWSEEGGEREREREEGREGPYARELRALAYARQRQLAVELPRSDGWPTITAAEGRVVWDPQDPPGVLSYEPPASVWVEEREGEGKGYPPAPQPPLSQRGDNVLPTEAAASTRRYAQDVINEIFGAAKVASKSNAA
ncbi:unnamed protein product [Phytomonas sp. EM1]|nr:unnamed protein product [Phytomonas sp. EM1]|eukprot:CCW65493.1 unnamed protein product [Phytomonas sp. isolate EM1]